MAHGQRRPMTRLLRCLQALAAAALLVVPAMPSWAEVRIKDIAHFEGVRENHLIGYGLVVGLLGTGDKLNSSPFTRESIRGMLERLGVANLDGEALKTKNTAAVMVTAKLPPFARRGSPIDITVSSLGDATSLRGGTLLITPLTGADGEVYAVGQGAVAASGYRVDGNAASVVDGVPTIARIENGAIVEREIEFSLFQLDSIRIALNNPDFTTADRVREAIAKHLGSSQVEVLDSGTIEVWVGDKRNAPETIMAVENLLVTPDAVARVVIDEKSGTIVMGSDVRIAQVAISQGADRARAREFRRQPARSDQPWRKYGRDQRGTYLYRGTTVIVPETEIDIEETDGSFTILNGDVSLQELVDGLNAIGVGARQTIAILQAIKAAGALHADLEII